ncbi:MAG TPA: hypothetical protein EYP36_08635, partial [Calditrichaeota bacterium]|nr:hypothetical protein [Calditrichota bacterium]
LIFIFLQIVAAQEVKEIHFIGISEEDGDELSSVIDTEEDEQLDVRLVKLDRLLIAQYYKQRGYIEARVRDSLSLSEDRKSVNVFFRINRGKRFYYSRTSFNGVSPGFQKRVAKQFKELDPKVPFNENKITAALRNIEDIYYNSGKPFVQIDVNYLFEKDTMVIVLVQVTENQTVIIGDIHYSGLKNVQQFIIRRELEIKKGDIYKREAIEESQKNIYRTGLFKFVRLELEPIKDKPNEAVLNISVEEKDAKWVGVHLGLALQEGRSYGNRLELTLQGGHRNLFGTARSISLHLTPAVVYDYQKGAIHNIENRLNLRFVEPWVFYTRTPGVLNVFYEQHRPLNSGSFDLTGTSFAMTHECNDDIRLSGAISGKFVRQLSGQEIDSSYQKQYQTDQNTIYALTFYWKEDTRQNIFYPKNSSYSDASMAFSFSKGKDSLGLPVENKYIRLIASWQRYQPLRSSIIKVNRYNVTMASRIKLGALIEPWKNKQIPINDRFYAGGATTVRGYQESLLGPALEYDANGKIKKAAGGKLLFLANLEFRIPLVWLLVLETFIDSGNVWAEIKDFKPGDIRFTTGVGLAVLTPLGPIRFDYGYKLTKTDSDPTPDAWHMGIYFAF